MNNNSMDRPTHLTQNTSTPHINQKEEEQPAPMQKRII